MKSNSNKNGTMDTPKVIPHNSQVIHRKRGVIHILLSFRQKAN